MAFPLLMLVAVMTVVPVGIYLTVRYPNVVMVAAFVMTPFQTALFGEGAEVKMGVVDLLATAMCLPLAARLVSRGSLVCGWVSAFISVFLAAATFSSFAAGITSEAGVSLTRMLTNTLLPVLLYANLDRRLITCHHCYQGYLVAVNVMSLCVLAYFAKGGFLASMYTLGMSKNFIGPVLGCGIGIAVVYALTDGLRGQRGMWLVGTLGLASVALVLTLSRGAWIATAVGVLIAVCTTRNVKLVVAGTLIGATACGLGWKLLPDTATKYASNVSAESSTIKLRLEYIDYVVDQFKSSPVIGVGVGLRKVMEPHNVLILTAGETGVVGLVTFLGMFAAGFWTTILTWRRTRFVTPAKQIAVMATVVLCVTLVDGMMDVYWRRGIGFMGWAGVGMAVLIGRSFPVTQPTRQRGFEVVLAVRREMATDLGTPAGATGAVVNRHVLVDARFSDHRRGGDRCRLELARGLMRLGGCRYTFLVYPRGADLLRTIDPAVSTVPAKHAPSRHPHADVFEHVTIGKICRKLKVDLYHGTFQVMPWRRAAPVTVATIHDLALFDFPEAYGRKFGPFMRTLLRRSIKKSDHLITVSQATADLVRRRFPKSAGKITPILNGVGDEFSPTVTPPAGLKAEYVLFVGNLERKKNLPRLIRAFLSLRSAGAITAWLLVVGSKPDKLPADELADLFGGETPEALGVIFLGYVSDEQLPAIYAGAAAVAYPSLYEGFGMPVLEAMAAGVPVLTSNVSSLPEVAGGAAKLVDPTDVGEIAAGLVTVLSDRPWRRKAVAAGLARAATLSWAENARRVEALYLKLLGG